MNPLRYFFGEVFAYFRRCYIYYKSTSIKKRFPKIHPSVSIQYETNIYGNPDDIEIGEGTYIQNNCCINGKVKIGKNCAIAKGVEILSEAHRVMGDNIRIIKPIVIGDNVWIGVNSYIKQGVTIGNHAIIGANSVVKHDIPANTIFRGD